jgi:hypothetical protein
MNTKLKQDRRIPTLQQPTIVQNLTRGKEKDQTKWNHQHHRPINDNNNTTQDGTRNTTTVEDGKAITVLIRNESPELHHKDHQSGVTEERRRSRRVRKTQRHGHDAHQSYDEYHQYHQHLTKMQDHGHDHDQQRHGHDDHHYHHLKTAYIYQNMCRQHPQPHSSNNDPKREEVYPKRQDPDRQLQEHGDWTEMQKAQLRPGPTRRPRRNLLQKHLL